MSKSLFLLVLGAISVAFVACEKKEDNKVQVEQVKEASADAHAGHAHAADAHAGHAHAADAHAAAPAATDAQAASPVATEAPAAVSAPAMPAPATADVAAAPGAPAK
jgi:hypothetical protein